ncbi:hypothetical protein [Nonomuraea sp. NPDC052265]|uniref:hypothetical protein n=1 Tax=Nonomuraea sp. NPDC052265 TaxID=3364374 RepID=UPI0037C9F7ED
MLLLPTALAFAEGDIDSAGGWAVVALAAVTTIGLAVIAYRALGERARIERAMELGLGAGWRAAIDADLAAGLRRRPPWARILFLPVFRRRWDVRRVANLAYGDAGRRNMLDLYHHRSRPQGAPVLIHLHGGGYTGGHKNSQSLHFADRLRQTSANPVVYAELRGGNHAFDLYHSLRFEAVVDAVEGFTSWVRSRERRAAVGGPGRPLK